MVSYISSVLGITKMATPPASPTSPMSPTSPESPDKRRFDWLREYGNDKIIAMGTSNRVVDLIRGYLSEFSLELPRQIAQYSKDLPPFRVQAAKVTASFITDFVVHQMQHSKIDPNKSDWTDVFNQYKTAGTILKYQIKEFEPIIRETLFVNLLKAFDETSKKINAHEKNEAFMENLGTTVISTVIGHLNAIKSFNIGFKGDQGTYNDEMIKKFKEANADFYPVNPPPKTPPKPSDPPPPEKFFIDLSEQILQIAFPKVLGKKKEDSKEEPLAEQANAVILPDCIDREDYLAETVKMITGLNRKTVWEILQADVVPNILEKNIFKEATTKHNLNLMLLNTLEKLSETAPKTVDASKPIPKDALQTQLNDLSAKMIDAFFGNIQETLGNKLMGISIVKKKVSEMVGGIIREQLQEWNLSKIIDTGIESGLSSLHPGKWSESTPKQFLPQKNVLGPDGLPLKDAAGQAIVEDANDFKFRFPVTEEDKQSEEAGLALEAERTEHALKLKLDKFLNEYAGGFVGIGMAKPKHLFLNIFSFLVKAITLALCICALGIPLLYWGWAHINKKITDTIMAPQKRHLITQRDRIIKLLQEPVHGTLFRKIATIGTQAIIASVA